MVKKLLFIFFIFNFAFLPLHAQQWLWGRQAGKSIWAGGDGWNVTADKFGNAYETGNVGAPPLVFGADTLTCFGGFLVKYDAFGNILWATQPTHNTARVNEAATDTTGGIYITGQFIDTADFGSTRLIFNGNYCPYIARYDANGNALWAKQATAPTKGCYGWGNSVATDVSGNVYVYGSFWDTLQFGLQMVYSNKNVSNMFLAKYDANGNLLWARQSNSGVSYNSSVNPTCVTVDAKGYVYITGSFTDTAVFGTHTLIEKGTNAFLIKYDANGNLIWVEQSHGGKWERAQPCAIITDNKEGIYICGSFSTSRSKQDSLYFGSTMLISDTKNYSEIFLCKYDSSGNLQWAEQSEGERSTVYAGTVQLAQGEAGRITMLFQSSSSHFTFGGYSFNVPRSDSVWPSTGTTLVAKVDSAGNVECASFFATPNNFFGTHNMGDYPVPSAVGVGSDASGKYIYATGACFDDTLLFNNDSLVAGYSADIPFIARWQPCADPVPVVPPEPCNSFFIPNAFSPNGDGQNDILYVRGYCIKTMYLIILDRWGNKVFENENESIGWDGIYRGQPLNTGTYMWYLKGTMNDGTAFDKKGTVELVR